MLRKGDWGASWVIDPGCVGDCWFEVTEILESECFGLLFSVISVSKSSSSLSLLSSFSTFKTETSRQSTGVSSCDAIKVYEVISSEQRAWWLQPLGVSQQLSGSDSEALSSSDDIHEEFSASAK